MKIQWRQTESYEWTGTDDKENYSLLIHQSHSGKKWYWVIYKDEDKICTSLFEDDNYFFDTDTAKQNAEQALQDYLNEQASFTNCPERSIAD